MTALGGTVTSLALTAKQGIELVDPTLAAARAREQGGASTYFSANSGFFSAKQR